MRKKISATNENATHLSSIWKKKTIWKKKQASRLFGFEVKKVEHEAKDLRKLISKLNKSSDAAVQHQRE